MKKSELRQIIKEELNKKDRVIYDKFYNQTRSNVIRYIKAVRNLLGIEHSLYKEVTALLLKLDNIDEGVETAIKAHED